MILCEKHHNIFVVGDADQSIYRFRGAEPELFVSLGKYIPDIHTITMNKNYRSGEKIVNLSNQVIKLSKNRIKRESISENGTTGEVSMIKPNSLTKEVKDDLLHVIQAAKERKVGKKAIEDALPQNATSVDTAISEWKSAISQLYGKRKSNYDESDLIAAFEEKSFSISLVDNIINKIKELLDSGAKEDDIAILYYNKNESSLERLYNEIKTRWRLDTSYEPKNAVNDISQAAIDNYIMYKYTKDDSYLGSMVAELSEEDEYGVEYPLEHTLNEIKSTKDPYKAMLLAIHEKFHSKTGKPCGLYGKWLTHEAEIKALYKTRKNLFLNLSPEEKEMFLSPDEERELKTGIHLMTMHKSKGLEWKYVFVLGMSENVFPTYKGLTSLDGIESLEEQNRVCYVAFSRAKEKLFLCSNTLKNESAFAGVYTENTAVIETYQKEKMYRSIKDVTTVAYITPQGNTLGYAYKTVLSNGERVYFIADADDSYDLCPYCNQLVTSEIWDLNDTIRTVKLPKEAIPLVFGDYADMKVLEKLALNKEETLCEK